MASIVKVIEVLAEGSSIDDAVKSGVAEASKTVRNIKHVYVENISAIVEDGQVQKYRVNLKLSFVVG
ncbi:MAG: dodecin family protein [Pirellulaceae bacterium]